MTEFDATLEEVTAVLNYFYSGMIYDLPYLDYDALNVHPESPVHKPSLADMKSHYAEARQRIAAQRAQDRKESVFQQQYPLQQQIIILGTALRTAATFADFKNNAALVAMMTAYQNA